MDIKSLAGEFRAFVLKGNVVDLAVGIVIGASFKSVVDSMVADLITPLVGAIGGRPDFSSLYLGPLAVGKFLNAVIAFLILAAVVFFVVVKPLNALLARTLMQAQKNPQAAPLPEDVKLLTEIRDLLKAKQGS
jgi:large conductance mechanosensitive channel